MAKEKNSFDQVLAFDRQLWYFYTCNRGKIRSRYNERTKAFLDYNDKDKRSDAYLRRPQFEALEMYVFIKEFLGNKQIKDIFDDWANKRGDFSERSFYSVDKDGIPDMFADVTKEQTKITFKQMENVLEEYPNYIYALAMGLGKTTLMATCIFYEFYLANKYQKDPKYCHNVIVFAPDKTVLQSLKEIITIDKSLIVPKEAAEVLDANIKVHYLDDTSTSLTTLRNSNFNIIISNTQKIIVKKRSKELSAGEKLKNMPSLLAGLYEDEELREGDNLIKNSRFENLCKLKQLGIYVDEAHHLFGADLEKALHEKKEGASSTSLRMTINMINDSLKKDGSSIVACYNYTGTPYVKNQVLPEVVYSCGLHEAIRAGYLKDANPQGFDNVKDKDFLIASIKRFMDTYKGKTYEGLLPKMAIYAATVEEAVNVVKPIVEEAIADYGLSAKSVIVNVGDSKYTKEEDINNFNNLDIVDTEGSKKQFIILCEKGTEGWNCRSLFAVALFRDSFSKVFVLQSTMRCLRSITKEQHTAQIFLSKNNMDILDAELHANFNMSIKDLNNKEKKEKKTYHVKVNPPPRYLPVKVIHHEYSLTENEKTGAIDFGLRNADLSKYEAKIYVKHGMTSSSTVKEESADKYVERTEYSLFTLVGELSRYMNIPCIKLQALLEEAKDGIELILEKVNLYNDIVYDILVPKIFHHLYKIDCIKTTEEKKLLFLKEPKDSGYYEFKADQNLVVCESSDKYKAYKQKSFHADTYCFDSKPEAELFDQYMKSNKVKEVYFTGMFTSDQSELGIQYVDPESHRVRHYYPDFIAKMADDSYEIIEVKGDNKLEDSVVKAKAEAAEEIATESSMKYKMYAGSEIMKTEILEKEKQVTYDFNPDYGLLKVAESEPEYGKKKE